jgi:predicted double-glycine peptidase
MPHAAGTSKIDTGVACLVMLARFHGVAAEPDQIKHEFGQSGRSLDDSDLVRAAKYLKLKAGRVTSRWDRLQHLALPPIARHVDGHYFVIGKVDAQRVLIHDPLEKRPLTLLRETFEQAWDGGLILISRRSALPAAVRKFNFSWFVPVILNIRLRARCDIGHACSGEIVRKDFNRQRVRYIEPVLSGRTVCKERHRRTGKNGIGVRAHRYPTSLGGSAQNSLWDWYHRPAGN